MGKKYAVGVDLGATNVRVAVGDKKGTILSKRSEKTEKEKGPEAISEQIIEMIASTLHREFKPEDIKGIGIGSIGPLDPEKGAITKSPNLPYEFIPLVDPIRHKFGVPLYLLNDCTTAVVGEKEFGAGKEVENLVYVTLSTGIGGGAYVDGHLLLGKDNNAVEIGHFTIDFEGRLQCGCGKRGHWEAYCSGENIPHYVKMLLDEKEGEEKKESITAKMLYEAAKAGDELSLEIVEKIGKMNAVGLGNVINAYDPSVLTIGGTMTLKNPNLILAPVQRYVSDYAINRVPNIRITPLGEDAVLCGAIAMVFKPPFQDF